MKKKFKLTRNQELIFLSIASTIIIALILVFSILSLQSIMIYDERSSGIFLFLSFLFLSFANANLVLLNSPRFNNKKISFYKYIGLVLLYLSISIAFICIKFDKFAYLIMSGIFFLSIAVNRIFKAIEARKNIVSIICNLLLAAGAIALGIMILSEANNEAEFEFDMTFVCIVIMLVSLVELMAYAFSRMKLGTLMKIMRKTYAWEILYGLVVLVFSFSFVFSIFEPQFETYGDALWYSFATLTTIGFGDLVATNIITRILSVILGIYGIIVVAVLTSIIVNFYNETKGAHPQEIDEKKPDEENKKDSE